MNTYTAGAIIYVVVITFLVIGLLGGAMLILNLGMMSKRDEDKVGTRNPSDVGLLKNTRWPEEPTEPKRLPAEEEGEHPEEESGPGRAA